MSEHAERIRAGLARLEGGKRWTKGQLFEKTRHENTTVLTSYCMIGCVVADDYDNIECVTDAMPTLKIIADVIVEQYPELEPRPLLIKTPLRLDIPAVISSFNDGRNRSFADVERIMEKAAIKAEEVI